MLVSCRIVHSRSRPAYSYVDILFFFFFQGVRIELHSDRQNIVVFDDSSFIYFIFSKVSFGNKVRFIVIHFLFFLFSFFFFFFSIFSLVMRDRVKSVDRRYTFSSFPCWTSNVLCPNILAHHLSEKTLALVVREANEGGARIECFIILLFLPFHGYFLEENYFHLIAFYWFLFIFFWFNSFGGCQFPDGFHV